MILARFLKARQYDRAKAPRRVLLAWEYGAGYTHLANMLAVADHLQNAGVECLAALHDVRHSSRFAMLGIPVVQNYMWPLARRWPQHDRERTYIGFFDALGNLGFSDPQWVAAALTHYDGLFDLFRPDLVLAENAYGAQLAARGRLPVIAFGFGEYLPAIQSGTFVFPEAERTSWTAGEILDGLNRGIQSSGRMPLARLEEMFEIDAVFPFGPAAFDRNAAFRKGLALPAYVKDFRLGLQANSGNEIFVYLHTTGPWANSVLPALLSLRQPVRAHILDLAAGDRALLASSGVILEDDPIPIAQIITRSRCILHHGGVGLTAACLSSGLPQVILSKQPDNRASGAFVAEQGLGEHQDLHTATTDGIVQATRRAYENEALWSECQRRRSEFDAWFASDPTQLVAQESFRLLKLPSLSSGAAGIGR